MATKTLPPISARLARAMKKWPIPLDLNAVQTADERVVAALQAVINSGAALELLQALTGQEVTIDGVLQRITSRNQFTPGYLLAVRLLEEYYAELKVQTRRQMYPVQEGERPQLEVLFPADEPTKRTLIIGSHVDSTVGSSSGPEEDAPGADDDGTGTVCAMLLVALLVALRNAGVKFNINVRIVHFGSEEYQLLGSKHYATKLADEKDIEVVGMVQFEMMGYDGNGSRRVDLHDDGDKNGSHTLIEWFLAAAVRYGSDLYVVDINKFNPNRPSDHRPFLKRGFKAICTSEDSSNEGLNPNMHTSEDTIDKLDMGFYVEFMRMLCGGVVDLLTS